MRLNQRIILEDLEKVCALTDLADLKGSTVLVTGANGLLGSYFAHLLYYLNTRGFNIKADFVTKSAISSTSLLVGLLSDSRLRGVSRDLSKFTRYDTKYDFVIYAAGYSAPSRFLQDPLEAIDVNYVGMKSVLASCLDTNPEVKIVYLSSSEIYGSPEEGHFPTPESYPGNSAVDSPRACYIESKRLVEVMCSIYREQRGAAIRVARPALTYGPGLTLADQRVISQFIAKAYFHKLIEMLDEGSDLRCYCYVSDAIRQLINILLRGREFVYNVGSAEEEITIRCLAEMIGDLMGARVVGGGSRATEGLAAAPSRVKLDLRRVESEFGFQPIVGMAEGLKRTIDWNMALLSEQTP